MLIIDFLVIISTVGDIVTEKQFKIFCKLNKIENNFITTDGYFSNKPDIIGCAKIKNNYIVYNTNALGNVHEIGTFTNEHYAYIFLFSLVKNDLDLQANFHNIKLKELKKKK